MKTLFFVLVLLMTAQVRAQALTLEIPSEISYESGRSLCEKTYKSLIEHEKGFYVRVPADYARPEKGTTDVYSFFHRGFDPKKETLLYFTGGPGQPVHWGLFRQEQAFNVLIMEHRGVGCSRPPTRALYLDPAFYSSESVARDAEAVRRHLKIEKLTVYGISYGTIPATMYASLFPEATRSLILEGVVFEGGSALWEAPHRRKRLQKMLNTLPASVQERMADIHSLHGVPDTWFARLARTALMYNDGIAKLKERMLSLETEKGFKDLLNEVKSMYAPITYTPHVLFASNNIPYLMVSCQELGLESSDVSIYDALIEGVLTDKTDEETAALCRRLRAYGVRLYRADKYPVKVPVTYFQGSDDGATAAPESVRHYKNVPQGPKQIAILVRGGHNPNLELMSQENPFQKVLFTQAFRGQRLGAEPFRQLKEQNFTWAHALSGVWP